MALTGPPAAIPGREDPPDRSPAPPPSGATTAPAGQATPAPPSERPAVARTRVSTVFAILAISPLMRLAALRYAVPPGLPSRTGCDACGAPVGLTRPWPALGPAARCGRCRARVGPPPATVELVVLAAAVLLAFAGPPGGALPALIWWLGWTIPAILVDLAVTGCRTGSHCPRQPGPGCCSAWPRSTPTRGTGCEPSSAAPGWRSSSPAPPCCSAAAASGWATPSWRSASGALLGWYGWPVLLLGLMLRALRPGESGPAGHPPGQLEHPPALRPVPAARHDGRPPTGYLTRRPAGMGRRWSGAGAAGQFGDRPVGTVGAAAEHLAGRAGQQRGDHHGDQGADSTPAITSCG